MFGSFLLIASLYGSSKGQIEPYNYNSDTPLVIESETILHLLRMPDRQGSCILQILPSEKNALTDFSSRDRRPSLQYSTFHDAYVPVINQPGRKVTDPEPKGLERADLLALQLLRRLQSTVSSHVRFIQCVSTVILIASTNQALRVNWTGQYVRQIDKHFFLGEEHVLEQVLLMPQIQKLRWPIGIILRPLLTAHVPHEAAFPAFAEMLYFDQQDLVKRTIETLPSIFGLKVPIGGKPISTMCISDTVAVNPNSGGKRGGDKYFGFVVNFMVIASQFYNFSYTLTILQLQEKLASPQNSLSNLSTTLVTEETGVILGTPISIRKNGIASFSPVVDFAGIVFFTSYPQTAVADQALLYPFQNFVWFLIGISFCAFTLSFYLALHNSPEPEPGVVDATVSSKLLLSFFLASGIMLEQSYGRPSLQRSTAMQMLITLGLMGYLVTQIAYGSDLVSYLTTPDFSPMPQTFKELAARTDVQVQFAHHYGVEFIFFQNTTSAVYGKIRDRYQLAESKHQCVLDALEGHSACLIFEQAGLIRISSNFTLTQHGRNPLQKSIDSALTLPVAVSYPKFYKFSFEFDEIIARFIDTGHFAMWVKGFYNYHKAQSIRRIKEVENRKIYDLVRRTVVENPPYEPFPFRIIRSIWWLHNIGMIVASLVFLAEYLWCFVSGSNEQNSSFTQYTSSRRECLSTV